MSDKWDEAKAYSVVREILAENPSLLSAVVSGIAAGHAEALDRLRVELTWANMAMDAALMLSTKRVSKQATELLERAITKRLEAFGSNLNGAEKDFLATVRAKK